ncbi:MAG: IS4 family transposase, partial [Puniceicoccaceae bacterium]
MRGVKKLLHKPNGRILRDDEVILATRRARGQCPLRPRRVRALVELDGRETATEF